MPESELEESPKMRYIVLVLAFVVTSFTQVRTASAQQPPQQQVLVPYAVCGGTSQSELCQALDWVRQQQAAPSVAVPPLGAPPSVAVRPSPRCRSGHRGDECRCRARGGILQEGGRCVSTRSVVVQVAGDARDLTTRMTAAEAAIAQLRSSQAATNQRVSENTAGLSCLEVILLPNVGIDPVAARQRATEEHAAALGRTHGAYCADFYRVAYGLPAPQPARTATSPTPPPAPSRTPQVNNAHAPNPTTPPATEGPITVTFQ